MRDSCPDTWAHFLTNQRGLITVRVSRYGILRAGLVKAMAEFMHFKGCELGSIGRMRIVSVKKSSIDQFKNKCDLSYT